MHDYHSQDGGWGAPDGLLAHQISYSGMHGIQSASCYHVQLSTHPEQVCQEVNFSQMVQ